MKPVTQQLSEYLRDQGLFAAWVGPDANTYPAPILQREYMDETKLAPTDRCIFIKAAPGSGDRYSSSVPVTVAVVGTTSDAFVFPQHLAQLVYDALLQYVEGDNIVAIEPLGRVGGPYKMESGRFVYDFDISALVETGLIVRP